MAKNNGKTPGTQGTKGEETPHPKGKKFRSQLWFDNPENPGMTDVSSSSVMPKFT